MHGPERPASAESELHVCNCGEASGAVGGRLETKSISQIDLKALELVSQLGDSGIVTARVIPRLSFRSSWLILCLMKLHMDNCSSEAVMSTAWSRLSSGLVRNCSRRCDLAKQLHGLNLARDPPSVPTGVPRRLEQFRREIGSGPSRRPPALPVIKRQGALIGSRADCRRATTTSRSPVTGP